ncbi:leucine-rich repeat domain-containing protein [Parachlamydia sp. AcF125]|uniref:leucine-rich repeat domain-containing protein n=1 Tax=Parachlamydia sp. AcF125 TaxID=2795736 RepID=UPI001BC9DDEA|nr:leucine-rich repeat domain-containing protein [Parachlamydia sp. AcF125]MBS4168647.1 hypothetical protein [Parachlamydia sp. AcF125]
MLPPTTSSTQLDFHNTVSESIEDAVSGELMTKAVTLVPCGHTFNKNTVIQCLARNKLCPLDREPIERYVRNYTVRQLAEAVKTHPLEEVKQKPSEEAQEHFSRGKELCEKGKEKASFSAKEDYIELLFNLLEEPSVQEQESLKQMLESHLEGLVNQENEGLTVKEQENYKWTKNLLGESKKVRLFAVQKLQQIQQNPSFLSMPPLASAPAKQIQDSTLEAMAILYGKILHFHFPEERENLAEKAFILDSIYEIDSNLANEAKVPLIFKNLFKKAQSLSPLEFEDNNQQKEPFTLATYASYLLNINRFLLCQRMPGGEEYLNQAEIKALPFKQKGELFKEWIKEQGENIVMLDLNNAGLTFLPPEIGIFSQLHDLELSYNQLTTLPTSIGQLSRLIWLVLSHNQLTVLPASIGQLSQLQQLNLDHNRLKTLSVEIKRLHKCKITLNGNPLQNGG